MIKRQKGRFAKAAASSPAKPGSAEADTTPAVAAAPHAMTVPDMPAASAPDALLQTVSSEALQVASIEIQALPIEDAATRAAKPADDATPQASEPSGDSRAQAVEPSEDIRTRTADAVPAPHEVTPAAAEAVAPPQTIAPAIVPQPSVSAPTVAGRPEPALDPVAAFTEVNATLVAFLQSESRAALTHWRALAAAKSPADAIRLQVGEMQRAADASLTCFSVLAKRATRVAEAVRPR